MVQSLKKFSQPVANSLTYLPFYVAEGTTKSRHSSVIVTIRTNLDVCLVKQIQIILKLSGVINTA
jgi:hypothetical protein